MPSPVRLLLLWTLSISSINTAVAAPVVERDIIDTARAAGQFETLLGAVEATGLEAALRAPGPLTVFAPTDAAFAKLPPETLRALSTTQLKQILTYHVVEGAVRAAEAAAAGEATALSGESIAFSFSGGRLTAAGAPISATDIEARNGIIHVVDAVLMPEVGADRAAEAALRLAIRRGAPLFNAGQPEACAAIYEVTARTLLAFEAVDPQAQQLLRDALMEMEGLHSAADQAWLLRRAFDTILAMMATAG